jgi:hypothetical protein
LESGRAPFEGDAIDEIVVIIKTIESDSYYCSSQITTGYPACEEPGE